MAHITEDRVLETTTSTGTGALTLGGAVTGYRTFASGLTVGDTVWYSVWGVSGSGDPTGEWESGLGTYSGTNTLTRTTVLESSNAGSVVTLSAGTKYVAITLTAQRTAQFDNVGAMLLPAASEEPGIPVTGSYLYAREIAPGHTTVKVKRPSGVDTSLQDSVAFNKLLKWQGGPAVITPIGGGALTAATAGTSVTINAGSTAISAVSRTQYSTATTGNAINSLYVPGSTQSAEVLRGNITGQGGFKITARFTLSATRTGSRFFVGLRDLSTAPTNIDPFTATTPGVIGLAANLATDANWRIVHALTGTTPTNIQLGTNFPVNADLLEVVLFCRPYNGTAGNIGYRVRRFTNDAANPNRETTGTLSTNLPTGQTLLYFTMWMVNVGTPAASFQVASITIESDW